MSASGLISMAMADDPNEPSPTMVNVPKSILAEATEENEKPEQTMCESKTTKTGGELSDSDAENNDNTVQEVDELIQDLLTKCDDELKDVELPTDGVFIKDDLEEDSEKLQEYKTGLEHSVGEMKGMTIQIQAKCDQLIEKVNQSVHKLISALEDRKAVMVEEIASAFRIQLDKLSLHTASLEEGLETTEELIERVDKAKQLSDSEFSDEAVDIRGRFIIASNLVDVLTKDHQAMKDTCLPMEFNMEVYVNRKYKLRKLDLLRRSKKSMADSIKEQLSKEAKDDKENTEEDLANADSVLAAVGDSKQAFETLASYCELKKPPLVYATSAVNNIAVAGQSSTLGIQLPLAQQDQRSRFPPYQVVGNQIQATQPAILPQVYQTQAMQVQRAGGVQYFIPRTHSLQMVGGQVVSKPAVPTGIVPARSQGPSILGLQTIAKYGQQQQNVNRMDASQQYYVMPGSSQVKQTSGQVRGVPSATAVRSTFRPQHHTNLNTSSQTNYTPGVSQFRMKQPNIAMSSQGVAGNKRKLQMAPPARQPKKLKFRDLKVVSVKYKEDQDHKCRNRGREYNKLAYMYKTSQIKAFDVCFDECTAHSNIEVLNPKQIVYNPNRLVTPCKCTPDAQIPFEGVSVSIFGSQPLPAFKCYWEILVKNCAFTIGVAFRQVARSHILGNNASSWCIRYQPQRGMTFIHNCHQNPVSLYIPTITRLGILLDRDKGILEFLNADDKTTLVKVHTKFVSALYPVFGLGEGGSMTINAGFPYPSTIVSKRKHVLYPQPSGGVPPKLPQPSAQQASRGKPISASVSKPTSILPKATPMLSAANMTKTQNSVNVTPVNTGVSQVQRPATTYSPNVPTAVPVGIMSASQLSALPVAGGSTSGGTA